MSKLSTHHPLLSEKEAATLLGLSVRTLQAWRQRGTGPIFLKLGRRVVYTACDLDAFAGSCRRKNTIEPQVH